MFLFMIYHSRVKISHIYDENNPITKNRPQLFAGGFI